MLCSEDHGLAEEELLREAWPGAAIFLALADTDFQVLSGDFLEELSTFSHHPPQEELLSVRDSLSPPQPPQGLHQQRAERWETPHRAGNMVDAPQEQSACSQGQTRHVLNPVLKKQKQQEQFFLLPSLHS